MNITKKGPFSIPKITDDFPLYGRLLAGEIEKLISLPDFSNDKGLFILSDFGGEHKGADFTTYSILICSADKRSVFEHKTRELREKHNLNSPWKEYGFKDLRYGPIKRSLQEFLDLSNDYIHGFLLTISVDKNIESVFGFNKKESHRDIVNLLKDSDLGEWKGNEAEKVLRVCHAISIFMSVLAYTDQKFLWLCDKDSINEDGNSRDFSHTQHILGHCLSMYSDNLYEIYGFAKPFEKDAGTTDLLSITDFSAGIIQEVLQEKIKGKKINVSDEKEKLLKWMGTNSSFLTKLNLVFMKQGKEEWGVGMVDLQVKT